MNREEVLMVLSTLKAAYPHAYKDLTKRDGEALVALWERQFRNDDAQAVSAAVDALISTRTAGYSIVPGEVKEMLSRLRNAQELDSGAAWALVSKACANGIYGYREEFAKLPPEVQRAVGAPEQLRTWAVMDEETVNSVVASNFMKTYRTQRERQKEHEKLPEAVRTLISGINLKQIGD